MPKSYLVRLIDSHAIQMEYASEYVCCALCKSTPACTSVFHSDSQLPLHNDGSICNSFSSSIRLFSSWAFSLGCATKLVVIIAVMTIAAAYFVNVLMGVPLRLGDCGQRALGIQIIHIAEIRGRERICTEDNLFPSCGRRWDVHHNADCRRQKR